MTTKQFIQMENISKRFPGVQALDQVSFELKTGEVHALVGENGAGKSTLMKILSGVYRPDAGQIILDGDPVSLVDPRHAQELGISIVHQELNLFPNMTVSENILGGHMPSRGPLGFEDTARASRIASDFLAEFEQPIDPRTNLSALSLAQQQVVEICKALAQDARVLILDEPTSSLTEHETTILFRIIRQLRTEGLSIVYISHRLEETFEIADRVTVLRDGALVGTRAISETTMEILIRMMVGRELEDFYAESSETEGEVILEVSGLASEGRFQEVSFDLRKGEILGMAGLVGAGRTALALSLFGAVPANSGTIAVNGRVQDVNSPEAAMNLGIAYLPENRRDDGLFYNMTVSKNISVSHLDTYTRMGLINHRLESARARDLAQQLSIQTPSVEHQVRNLSGGNQQKVILARWLAIQPRVLIVDEPTRGIDVGAKVEIYALLRRLAEQGVGIILISSEMPEVLGMSDRILVMHQGRITGEIKGSEATEEDILAFATTGQSLGRV